MPTYTYGCPGCGARYEQDRPVAEAAAPAPCPVCTMPGARIITAPRLLFKADPREVRPVWHNHDGYSHQHAPRRGRHRTPSEEH